MEALFQVVNLAVLPAWLLMILLPRWRLTLGLMRSPLVLLPLPILYVVLIVPHLPDLPPLLLNPRLSEIAAALGRPEGALIGWVHFVAFDLFVGRWIYLDSRQRDASVWLMAPVLFLALMVGPAGLLAYLALRPWLGNGPAIEPSQTP